MLQLASNNDLIEAADLFCGGGGTTTGMKMAAKKLGLDIALIAVNHWKVAIATLSQNHADVEHRCQQVGTVRPLEVIPSGRLRLLAASPECTHHSNARGGKPRSDQKRADAWELFNWLTELYVENVLIENVREFRDWGPLGADGKPLKSGKGKYYRQFRDWLEVTYHVEEEILNAADYGDATTRERLFLICRRPAHKKIVWPVPSHASPEYIARERKQPRLFDIKRSRLKPWRTAREIIDWSLPSYSIFLTKEDVKRMGLKIKRPLSPNTTARIFSGLGKYPGLSMVLPHQHGSSGKNNVKSVESPLPTITGTSSDMFLAQPFLMNLIDRSGEEGANPQTTIMHQSVVEPFVFNMAHNNGKAKHESLCYPLDRPLTTIAGKGMYGLIEPFLVQFFGEREGQEPRTRTVDSPLWTVTAQGRMGLCETDGFIVKSYKGHDAASLDRPLPTVTAEYEHFALAQPFLTTYHGNHNGKHDGDKRTRSINEPLPTADASNRIALAQSFIVPVNHGKEDKRTHSVDEPMRAITGVDAFGLAECEPYLVKFYGTPETQGVDVQVATVTGNNHAGMSLPQVALVIPLLGVMLDIRFRMLQPVELAAAMGFPKSYSFAGTRDEQVRQIGNAVPVNLASALCRAILSDSNNKRVARVPRKTSLKRKAA